MQKDFARILGKQCSRREGFTRRRLSRLNLEFFPARGEPLPRFTAKILVILPNSWMAAEI